MSVRVPIEGIRRCRPSTRGALLLLLAGSLLSALGHLSSHGLAAMAVAQHGHAHDDGDGDAASRSGTVKPMWSVPRCPGMPWRGGGMAGPVRGPAGRRRAAGVGEHAREALAGVGDARGDVVDHRVFQKRMVGVARRSATTQRAAAVTVEQFGDGVHGVCPNQSRRGFQCCSFT